MPWLVCLMLFASVRSDASDLPDELYRGMVQFQLDSGNHFDALVYMDQTYIENDPLSYAAALNGFNMDGSVASIMDVIRSQKKELGSNELFRLGQIEYDSGNCIPALKAFKQLKNKLGLEKKQEWAFYRASCFIKLGSDTRAAQVLSDILSGIWISHAYYNLAMSYAETNSVKTKALVALRVAASLNEGESKAEQELNDRIHFAAGAIYLNEGKPDFATDFFKKVHLDSDTAPQALYLNGVAQLELNDFRSATQSWFSVKKYPVIHTGVAESLLAIPYAYERSGYVSQALEAYLEASTTFEKELQTIDKVSQSLKKHGFRRVLIEEDQLEGLEWFLAKDVARNTQRAAYYSYLAEDAGVYDSIELMLEMIMLRDSLQFWSSQLDVYQRSLKTKSQTFSQQSARFKPQSVNRKIAEFRKRANALNDASELSAPLARQLQIDRLPASVSALESRLKNLEQKIKRGRGRLDAQLAESAALKKRIQGKAVVLDGLIEELNDHITLKALERMAGLKQHMQANFERSEQGLVHILESIAESNQSRSNPLDGRYQ